jgi:hypothetical protein
MSAIVCIMQSIHETDVSGDILAREANYCHMLVPMYFDPLRYLASEDGIATSRKGMWPGFDFILVSVDIAFTGKEENDPTGNTAGGVWTDPTEASGGCRRAGPVLRHRIQPVRTSVTTLE